VSEKEAKSWRQFWPKLGRAFPLASRRARPRRRSVGTSSNSDKKPGPTFGRDVEKVDAPWLSYGARSAQTRPPEAGGELIVGRV